MCRGSEFILYIRNACERQQRGEDVEGICLERAQWKSMQLGLRDVAERKLWFKPRREITKGQSDTLTLSSHSSTRGMHYFNHWNSQHFISLLKITAPDLQVLQVRGTKSSQKHLFASVLYVWTLSSAASSAWINETEIATQGYSRHDWFHFKASLFFETYLYSIY